MARLAILFWLCFAATAIVYAVMVGWSLPRISAAAGGIMPFDLRPMGYGLEEARGFLAALTPEGRDFYLHTQHKLDALYPPLLALTLGLGLWIMSPSSSAWVRVPLVLLPVAGMIFDLAENRLVAGLLEMPAETVDAEPVMMASAATALKSIFTTIAMTLLLALTGLWFWQRRRARA